MAQLDDGETEYMGRRTGSSDTYTPAPTVTIGPNTYYTEATSPILLITNTELRFIEAEAAFMTDDKARAYSAYLEGIEAHMQKLGVDQADIDAYLADPAISVGAANLTLSDILVQKHIATFLQLEGWTDMRRYEYNTSIYVGLQEPLNKDQPGIDWIYRGKYPDNEPGRNANVPSIGGLPQAFKTWLFQ